MRKILFVIPSLGIGGAEKSLIELLNIINYQENDVSLLLLGDHGVLFEQVNPHVHVIDTNDQSKSILRNGKDSIKYLLKNFKFILAFKRFVASFVHRIKIHSSFYEWKLLKNAFPAFQEEYDISIAYLQGISEYYVIDKTRAREKILWMHTSFKAHNDAAKDENNYINAFNKIVCVSEAAKSDFISLFPSKKDSTIVFYNIIDKEKIIEESKESAEIDFDNEFFNIISVGRLHYAKGYDISINAFMKFHSCYPKSKFYIVGDGEEKKKLLEMIENYGIKDSCILLGSQLNPYKFISQATVVLQTSRYEGFCIVLSEAKILKKAIITTDFFGAREQIQDGVNGKIISCDEYSIFNALGELYTHPEEIIAFENNLKDADERDYMKEFDNLLCL